MLHSLYTHVEQMAFKMVSIENMVAKEGLIFSREPIGEGPDLEVKNSSQEHLLD